MRFEIWDLRSGNWDLRIAMGIGVMGVLKREFFAKFFEGTRLRAGSWDIDGSASFWRMGWLGIGKMGERFSKMHRNG